MAALDAPLDAGADIEARGGVIGGGTPLDDAVAFGQWNAARRLVARGAHPWLWNASALGLLAEVIDQCGGDPALRRLARSRTTQPGAAKRTMSLPGCSAEARDLRPSESAAGALGERHGEQ